MLKPNGRQVAAQANQSSQSLLKLVLFVDQRPSSQTYIKRLQNYLKELKAVYPFKLQVIEVEKQPYLVEHFKLVATPALVKIYPEPKQTIAGSDLIPELKKWWVKWQKNVEEKQAKLTLEGNGNALTSDIGQAAEIMRLSDEIFRLEQEKEELVEQLKFKDQVLAMLAHDLRSPLTAASIALETIELAQNKDKENSKSKALKKQLFRQAKSQFKTMNLMITDILQAAQGKSSELKVNPHQLLLQSLAQEVVEQFHNSLKAKKQQLKADFPQDLPPVYGDPELLRQVFVNLLENAVKYTPEGGKISISMLHRTSQKIQVSICDNGPGIPHEQREMIFKDHFRLPRDRDQEGYGLGLSLCQSVIRLHYGQIWVDSNPSQGSCFHFTLPVYRA